MAALAVGRPGGRRRLPLQPLHGSAEVGQLRVDQLRAEPGPLELALHVALGVGVGVARLGASVEAHVGEEVAPKPLAAADERAPRWWGRCRAPIRAAMGWNGTSAIGLQVERVEEQLAELAVAGPRLTGHESLERADVDEHRPAAVELHVVGGGVLGEDALGQRLAAELELEQRGVLQHREGPLVGVGDHPDAIVAEGPGPPGADRGVGDRQRGRGDNPAVGLRGAKAPVAA